MKPILFDEDGNSIRRDIPEPSKKLIDNSSILSSEKRKRIIDLAGKYVNKNKYDIIGRASMCQQFAILVKHMLLKENIESEIFTGSATYTNGIVKFSWTHFWVEIANIELIDCNIDSIIFHPDVPDGIEPYNYWGDMYSIPDDRVFAKNQVFSDIDIAQLEKIDDETFIWKEEIDEIY